jgi:hypothetical protein
MHDHPWNFWSLILSGGYDEYEGDALGFHTRKPGSLAFKYATEFHTFKLLKRHLDGPEIPNTSIVLTGPRVKKWGYKVDGRWVDHKSYRKFKRRAITEGDRVEWGLSPLGMHHSKQGTVTSKPEVVGESKIKRVDIEWDDGTENNQPAYFLNKL